jgi:hypothetical protein
LKFHPINLLFDPIVAVVREECPSTSPSDIQDSDDFDISFDFSLPGHLDLSEGKVEHTGSLMRNLLTYCLCGKYLAVIFDSCTGLIEEHLIVPPPSQKA